MKVVPNSVAFVDISLIKVDAKRFQYKIVHGKNGCTGSLSGVTAWNEILAGIVLIWEDPETGFFYCINGHNRFEKAVQLGVTSILCRFIDAKNAREARSIGALTNIGEGQGTSIDCGKFFRDSEYSVLQLKEFGVNTNSEMVKQGLLLNNLERSLFSKVVQGEIAIERACLIGSVDLKDQLPLVDLINKQEAKKRKITNDVILELIDTIKNAVTQQQTLFDLFGSCESSQNLALTKLELMAKVRSTLAKNKRLYSLVAKSDNAQKLEQLGNVLNMTANASVSEQSELVLRVFDDLKNKSGKISQILNDGTSQIERGEPIKKVQETIVDKLVIEIPKLLKLA